MAELIDFGLLRDTLLERYEDTFAGLVNNGNNSITIYETRPSNELHTWVNQRFVDAASRNGIDPKLIPTVTYRTAALTLSALFDLKARIMADVGTLKRLGVTVESIGVQDGSNKLIVGVSTSVPVAQMLLEKLYGRGRLLVIEWKMTNEADRYNDSSPWNGGDQIVSEGTPLHGLHHGVRGPRREQPLRHHRGALQHPLLVEHVGGLPRP